MSAGLSDVCLVGQGLLSAYGAGVEICVDGLMSGRCAFTPAGERFPAPLAALPLGVVPCDVFSPSSSNSRFMALLQALFAGSTFPSDARVYVATTVGEITELEDEVLSQINGAFSPQGKGECASLAHLPQRLAGVLNITADHIQVVSSACASSTVALALASSAIRLGEISCALVVGCDTVSEFTLSGFAALMAVDAEGARPFDAARRGVTLGEAAVYALLMRRERAEQEGCPALGIIDGWGMTCDANHLTGPSRDGKPLADAMQLALRMADCQADDVVAICAHGTGTVYNDQMEMLAFKDVFASRCVPVFSVKGGMGHTLGAAGLAEVLLSLAFLRRGCVPMTVGLKHTSVDAVGWATDRAHTVLSSGHILTTNSGFGGINAAVVLSLASDVSLSPVDVGEKKTMCVSGRGCARAGLAVPEIVPFSLHRNFGRFSAEARLAFYAIAQALRDAHLNPMAAGTRMGIIAVDHDGCAAANRVYFSDYVQSGRVLGRGQLFVYTLPTSVAAECAIACHLVGPLMYVTEGRGGAESAVRALCGLMSEAAAEAFVLVSSTPQMATAVVVTAGGVLPEMAVAAEAEAYLKNGC